MTGATIMFFLVLVPLTGLALWYRRQGERTQPTKATPHTMRAYDPIKRQRAYYQRRMRVMQEQQAALVMLLLITMRTSR